MTRRRSYGEGTGVGSGGYAGDLTTQLFMWEDIDMNIPLEKSNT